MGKSIRWRLQFWYAVVLTVVVSGFAILLYYEVRAARYREIDADLVGAANYLESTLRPWPAPELESANPSKREFSAPFRPPPTPLESRILELVPPGWPVMDMASDRYFAVWRADGSTIRAVGLPEDFSPSQLAAARRQGSQSEVSSPYGTSRPVARTRGQSREIIMLGPHESRILVGIKTDKVTGELHSFIWQLAIAGATVLVIGLAGGWWVSSRMLRPLARISATASRISATNLSERIEAEDVETELAELAVVLNAAFDRLESAFAQLTRFAADASHELRTPLAILKSHTELALSKPRSVPEYRQTIETCAVAAERMAHLVEGLLTLARADAGKLDLQQAPVELAGVAEEVVTVLRPMADEKKITLHSELEPLCVTGDAAALAQVIRNLIENAVRYNREGGHVKVKLVEINDKAVLTVTDTGLGVPVDDRPHIFERFYRVDKARSRASGGAGLGLAICKSIVEAHGGSIGFKSREGKGTEFHFAIPLREEEEA
jgi:heavy metal sensor kinase